MTSHHLVRATTAQDAIDLMLSAPVAFNSPTNHRLRDRALLERAFAAGRRRPEWVWAARDDHRILATVAGNALVLDHWGARQPADLDVPLHAANRTVRTMPGSEACFHLPATTAPSDPAVGEWLETFARHDWTLLVQRHHYETKATPGLASGSSSELRLEPLTGPDDARPRPLFRSILQDSLDAHDVQLVNQVGLSSAADQTVDELLDADPWQCIRLAFDGGTDPVGMVSWVTVSNQRGYVNHIGVSAPARGSGHGRRLLARATSELIKEGATVLIADTDATNHPMVAAFEHVGWTTRETRLDFVLD